MKIREMFAGCSLMDIKRIKIPWDAVACQACETCEVRAEVIKRSHHSLFLFMSEECQFKWENSGRRDTNNGLKSDNDEGNN